MKRGSKPTPIADVAKMVGIRSGTPALVLLRRLKRLRKTEGVDLLVRMNEPDARVPRYGVHLASLRRHAPDLFGDISEVEAIEQNTDALNLIGTKLRDIDNRIDIVESTLAGIQEALKTRPFRRVG